MCGIAGAFGARDADGVVRAMTDSIAHRGRDAHGHMTLRDGRGAPLGAAGHRRLAVVDLSPTGCQPMLTPDERLVIVFNGEIYNFRELRADLEKRGARFNGTSDTEVILAGWQLYGPRYVERLRGMFAFALWDRDTATGWLVRDPFGIKPLYIAQSAGALLFGSEVRALLASGLVPRQLSRSAIAGYLAAGSVRETQSMIRGVESLPAGGVASVRIEHGRARMSLEFVTDPYVPPARERERDPLAGARIVRDALRDSVAHHLIADVPVALFLSGGIDSSAIAAFAAEATPERLDGFTVVFREAAFDESGPARAVARRFGFRHHEIPLAASDLLGALPDAFVAMDQPSQDGLNTYVVSRAVRAAGTKVVLSGLGGDEMFAGYPAFPRAGRLSRAERFLPRAVRPLAAALLTRFGPRGEKAAMMLREGDPARGAYLASRTMFAPELRRSLLAGPVEDALDTPAAPAALSLLQRVSWYELTGYMRDTLLRDSDVFSMAHHLELRVPFVDRRVLEASLSVDDSLKLDARTNKPLIIAAMGDLLPREVWNRPKQGFALPFAPWMRSELRHEVGALLTSAARLERVAIAGPAAREVWEGFLAGRSGYSWSRPWALYTLARWAETLDASVTAATRPAQADLPPVLAL